MLRNPRVWLWVSGGWLVAAALAHLGWHVWTLGLENGFGGLREFAMNAMKQAQSPNPLRPSMWRHHRLFSLSYGLLLLLAGSVNLVLAGMRAELRLVRAFSLLGTLFWTAAFVPFAFVDPVFMPLLVAAVAVPLHAITHVTASLSEMEGGPRRSSPSQLA